MNPFSNIIDYTTPEKSISVVNNSEVEYVSIDDIRIRENEEINVGELQPLLENIADENEMKPIEINKENFIVDGRKRFILALQRGYSCVPVIRKKETTKRIF
jgi:hypothetical protein